jgi:hypothetical protein
MFYKKHIVNNYILIAIIFNIITCQKLSNDLLETWGEKTICEKTQYFSDILEIVENYFVKEEGYSLEETDIIPFGFFKQTINGINYRLLCAIKKKSSDTPTIFDIIIHKHNNEFKLVSSKSLEDSSTDMSEKNKKKMEAAIMKYYIKEAYNIKEFEIEYEYHNLGGLYNYAIYDVIASLEVDDESVEKRLLIIFRNDRTFTVEEELKAEE